MTVSVSFEVFPPKTSEAHSGLATALDRLASRQPRFVSVTYGAGGSDRERSFAAIAAARDAGVEVAAHLTCVGQSVDDVHAVVERFEALGVSQIVALRGDPPKGIDAAYSAHPDGYQHTADLVAAIADRGSFEVTVSAYPEKHPQSPSAGHDLDVLAGKVAAGARRAITQMCFDTEAVLRLRDRIEARRIDVELVPGVFPIHDFGAVSRFAARCGASIPHAIAARFRRIEHDLQATAHAGAELAAEQLDRFAAEGLAHAHLYTLNRAELVIDTLDRLTIKRLTRTRAA